MTDLITKIDTLLPQTQCGECGYAGCRPYANALAKGEDTPNHCPPGGLETLQALGKLLNIDISPYQAEVTARPHQDSLAIIREDDCIGCTKCIQACPVDAIIGAAKQMHTVIAEECTGCELCLEPCPVDCIDMQALSQARYDPQQARERHLAKTLRQQVAPLSQTPTHTTKLSYIQQAILRKQTKKANR